MRKSISLLSLLLLMYILVGDTVGKGVGKGGNRGVAWAQPMQVTMRPTDTGVALINPGMGWVFHHYDNSINGYGPPLGPAYNGSDFPGLSVVYLRLAWSHLEPQEGWFNWSILDTPIQRYGAAGKRFALRFTVFEGDPKQGTPEWVRAAGAQGKIVETFGIKSWEPDYDDPIFLSKLEAFLMAAGRRYGNSPLLAYADVGTLGIWGEGHPIARKYGLDTLRRHIELHRKAFPNTLLVAVDDWAQWFREEGQPPTAAMNLARELGLTFRDDSLLVYADPKLHYSAHLAAPFWPERPIILEMDHYGASKNKKTWGDGNRYYQAVEDYHGSYISIHANPIEFLKENSSLVAKINRRLGYRLNIVEVAWPEKIKRSEGLTIEAQWRNVGVAPCLPGGYPAWFLFDSQENLCAVLVDDEWNVRALAPNAQDKVTTKRWRNFAFPPSLKPGRYELRVSIGDTSGTPHISLPLQDDDGHRRYRLGQLQIE